MFDENAIHYVVLQSKSQKSVKKKCNVLLKKNEKPGHLNFKRQKNLESN